MEGLENKENLKFCVNMNRRPPGQIKWAKSDNNYLLTLSTHLVGFHPLQAVRGEMVQRMVKMGGTLDHRARQF